MERRMDLCQGWRIRIHSLPHSLDGLYISFCKFVSIHENDFTLPSLRYAFISTHDGHANRETFKS
jgi:hypothetical protein